MATTSRSSAGFSRSRSSFGSVKLTSVRPSCETFWTIMSTPTPSSATERKIAAAMPGRSGTSWIVTLASVSSHATPEISASSIRTSSSTIHVPASSVNEDAT